MTGLVGRITMQNMIHRSRFLPLSPRSSTNQNAVATLMRRMRTFSSTANNQESINIIEESPVTKLGLVDRFVHIETLQNIRQLPEIQSFLDEPNKQHNNYSQLDRAIDIFKSSMPNEYIACLALLAETQCNLGDIEHCKNTIQQLVSATSSSSNGSSSNTNTVIDLARAKLAWLEGEFELSKDICDTLLETNNNNNNLSSDMYFVARTGQAISRLLLVENIDDVFSVRDPFRMVIKQLERSPIRTPLSMAASQMNMGIAESIYAQIVAKEHDDIEVPIDPAMRQWKQALTSLKNCNTKTNNQNNIIYVKANVLTNMGWGMMQMVKEKDYLKRSTEFLSEAMKLLDNEGINDKTKNEILPRTLTLLAKCYHKNGGAVTAEGLLQSAKIDDRSLNHNNTLLQLIQRETLITYSDLCNDWDKRKGDADKLFKQAQDIDNTILPKKWKGKSIIHSSLWFYTLSDIFRQ